MPLGRPLSPLTLLPAERQPLSDWSRRPKTAQALALRARIILLCAAGLSNTEVARRLRVTGATVCKWRQRFVHLRLDGLLDEPRPGTPRRLPDAEIERVLARTLETQPPAATHWSTRSLAQATGLSQSSISRIWRAFSLQPHRSGTFNPSPDQPSTAKDRHTGAPHRPPRPPPGPAGRLSPASGRPGCPRCPGHLRARGCPGRSADSAPPGRRTARQSAWRRKRHTACASGAVRRACRTCTPSSRSNTR